MITQKMYGVREVTIAAVVALALLLVGASSAFAQTTSAYNPPAGYSQYNNSGVYYNSSTGQYYNPMTGQYSVSAPLGQASMSNGSYVIPSGYTSSGTTGQYYNSTTGYYYDPSTGFYSQNAPMSTGVTSWQAMNPGATNTSTNTSTGTTGSIATYPTGYGTYGSNGLYYNSTTRQYYNPTTGQYSTTQPGTPASRDANGAFVVPSGYFPYADTGAYYNSSTGTYYDPSTGFYSTQVPIYQGINGGVITPGLPNTGLGGEASKSIAILVMSALVAATGVVLMKKQKLA